MKKTILFGLAAAMLATACSEEDDLRQGIAGEGITFTSSVMSRATDTRFEAEDAIGVSMYTKSGFVGNATNVQYTTKNGTAFTSTNPMTWGAAGSAETVDFKGVYPYKAEAVDGKYSFTLATDDGASLSDNDVMYSSMTGVAVGAKNVELKFKHKLVKVVMQVYDQNRNPLPDATVKINNQQISGTLNLADGTVTSTGTADATLNFARNSDVSGGYQTIVMPSAPTQGRVITITYKNVDYPCPVDMYAFDSGSKMIFSVTLNPESGTASQGTIVNATATVENWTEQRIESGWIFGEGDSFVVKGKTSYQLAENVKLASAPIQVGNLGRDLDEKDVYSLEYTRTSAETDAAITISGKSYTLPAGQTAGTLLVAAGTNLRGINVSSGTEGITLAKVLVYSNENIGLPITLWTGNGSAGNGTADSDGLLAHITLTENQRNLFVTGALLRCYSPSGSDMALKLGTLPLSGYNLGYILNKQQADSDTLTAALTVALYEEVEDGNIKIYGQGGSKLDKVELIPNPESEDFTDLLWCRELEGDADCMMQYGDFLFIIPKSLKADDIIRVYCYPSFPNTDNPYLEGVAGDAVGGNAQPPYEGAERILPTTYVSKETHQGYIDYPINESTCETMLGLKCGTIIMNGEALSVHKVQLVRGSGE